MFEIFDKDNSGTISLEEFIDAMHQFAGKSTDDKIKFLFKVYDLDGKYNLPKYETLRNITYYVVILPKLRRKGKNKKSFSKKALFLILAAILRLRFLFR